jgi:hypothetical protein
LLCKDGSYSHIALAFSSLNGGNLGNVAHHSNVGNVDNMAKTAKIGMLVSRSMIRWNNIQKLIFFGLPAVVPPLCVELLDNLTCRIVI